MNAYELMPGVKERVNVSAADSLATICRNAFLLSLQKETLHKAFMLELNIYVELRK